MVKRKITANLAVIFLEMARGNNPNSLRSFAILLEKHPTGLLAGVAFAPYKRFAAGRIHFARTFQSPKGGATNGSEAQRKMRLVSTSRIFLFDKKDAGPSNRSQAVCKRGACIRSLQRICFLPLQPLAFAIIQKTH